MIKRINITKVLKKHHVITLLDLNNMCVENNIDIIVSKNEVYMEFEIIKNY